MTTRAPESNPGYARQLLERELIRDEGLQSKVYRCTAGKLTIGVGRNLDDVGIRPEERIELGITRADLVRRGITRTEAMVLLRHDIDHCEADLDRKLPWWRRLSPVRQRVILNMCFNLGITRLLGFRNTLKFMAAGDYAAAARGMKASKWAEQVKSRATRLIAMMLNDRTAA